MAEPQFVPVETSIEVQVEEARARLVLAGALTTRASEALLGAAREVAAARRDVVVDCARLEFLGLAALQILLALRRRCERGGGTVRLVDVAPSVAELLAITGFGAALGVGARAGGQAA